MILIFSEKQTDRQKYAFELVLKTILGIDPVFTTDKNKFIQSPLPKINYSDINLNSGLYIKPYSLLFERKISTQDLSAVEFEGARYFFRTSDDSFLPFDPFALSFYLASRYEEYLYFESGKHGRYPSHKTILYQNKLLDKPVVNMVANMVRRKLEESFPDLQFPDREFRFLTTIDIDNAWAFKHKGFFRSGGGLLKTVLKFRFSELLFRLRVLSGTRKDPYDTYDYVAELYASMPEHLQFFILIGNRKKYDKSVPFGNRNFQKLIKSLSEDYNVGLHPSYASNKKEKSLQLEKARLEKITGHPVSKSRQHFLMLKFPQTYRSIIKLGIKEDYTMGFSSRLGFRAGICTPFYFFDLKKNKQTNLLVHPFQVMDVTLKNYRRYGVKKAISEIENLMNEVKKVNGTFVSLWHNESLSDQGQWTGWREVFEFVLDLGTKLENE